MGLGALTFGIFTRGIFAFTLGIFGTVLLATL